MPNINKLGKSVMTPRVLDTAAPLVTKTLLAAAAPVDAVGEAIALLPQVKPETIEQIANKPAGISMIPGVGGYNRGQIQRRTGLDYQEKFKKKNSKYAHEVLGTYMNVLGIGAIGAVATLIASKSKDRTFKNAGMAALKFGTGAGFLQLGGALAAGLTPKLTDEQLYQQEQRPAIGNYLIPGLGAYRGYKRLGKGYSKVEEFREEKDKQSDSSVSNHQPIAKEAGLFDFFSRLSTKGHGPKVEPDYTLDDRPEDLPPGIYQGSRNVFQGKFGKEFLPGVHGFLFMVPKDKKMFKEHLQEVGGGVRGILISGYNDPAGKGLEGVFNRQLTGGINKPRDIQGIKLLLSNKRDPDNRDTKLYNITEDEQDVDSKIKSIVDMTKNYQANTKKEPFKYVTWPKPGTNCISYVETVSKLAKLKNRVKNYQGYGPGIDEPIPHRLFMSPSSSSGGVSA
jgi:hypothetical protein